MSLQYGKLCSEIIKQYFGETVQRVADALFSSTCRTLFTLIKCTKLTKSEVSLALAILIKFRLVKFEVSTINENIGEYIIQKESILFILRYPRYVHLMQSKHGNVGAAITEELLRSGSQTASSVIMKCFASAENKDKLASFRDTIIDMIQANYLIRIPVLCDPSKIDSIPKLEVKAHELFLPPNIDLFELQKLQSGNSTEDNAYWQINIDKFHRDFRDNLMISAVERKLGQSAAECFRYVLQQTYEKTDAWQHTILHPISFVEVKQTIEKKSNNLELIKYLDQYMSLIVDDSLGFVKKVGESGGGQYIVELKKAFECLLTCCTENVILEKFGTKASRIFRVIKSKNYTEQEEIQKEAMVPAKEAKLLTYKLFEEGFIQTKTIRKAGGGGTGPAKAFYLFHVNDSQVSKMLLDICYKALFNAITRSKHEKTENKRLMEKSQRLVSIVETMKERGESEEYIAEILETLTPPEREILEKVKLRIQTLSSSELAIDETIFLLQMYQYYNGGNTQTS